MDWKPKYGWRATRSGGARRVVMFKVTVSGDVREW